MSAPINLTRTEIESAAADMDIPGGMGFEARRQVAEAVIRSVNKVRARNEVFRALTRDLERLDRSGMTFGDRARDLLLSYDVEPKPDLPAIYTPEVS